jgi:hypothetical protein
MSIDLAKSSDPRPSSLLLVWPLSPILLGACFVVAPASTAGFLDFDQGWTGASVCADISSVGCVDRVQPTSVTLIGYDAVDSQLVYISPAVPAAQFGYSNLSFSYAFDPDLNQSAFYTLAGNLVPLSSTGGVDSAVVVTGVLGPGQSISFGVVNTNNAFPAELVLTNFSYSAVPAPFALAGAGAAYGWARRLRSLQRRRSGPFRLGRADMLPRRRGAGGSQGKPDY